MTGQVRVAVVGCGAIARRAHVPAWLANAHSQLVTLVDPVEAAAQEIVRRHHLDARFCASLDDALAGDKPDVVDICTSTPFHYPLARQALEAGCHVLLEKPPTPVLDQAHELAALATARNLKLGCVLNYRYRDLILQLKQIKDDGLLGEVTKICITHHGPLVFSDSPWLWNERESRYLVREFGIHLLDIMVYLLGPHVEVLHVIPIVEPGIGHTTEVDVTVQFPHGAIGKLEIAADSTRHSSFFTEIQVYGTGMDAFVRWFPPSLSLVSGQLHPLAALSNEFRALWQIGTKILTGQFLKQRNISHHRLIDSYVDWIVGNSDFPLTMANVLPTLRLLAEVEQHVPTYVNAGAELTELCR